jgi:hypothetical protein
MPDDVADLSPDPGMNNWRALQPLSEADCMSLLAGGGMARLVYSSRYGPTALPVVYRIDGESIVVGTWDPALFDEDLRTGIAHAEYQVAVEVDLIDLEAREGWIVLVRGAAHHIDTEAERALLIGPDLEPWIEGVPAHLIRVTPTSTWGNRILRA